MRGIFAIDPGGSTGVAWGIFNDRAKTALVAMSEGIDKGSITLSGDEMLQAKELFKLWMAFKEKTVRTNLMPPESIELIIEDFTLFPGQHAGGKEGIMPVRVGWAFEGYRQARGDKFSPAKHVTAAVWQPSTVMKYEQQLKRCDCWVRGKEHERSAFCHILGRLRKVLR